MTTVLSVCNQKGGVGKTTTSVNLSSALAKNKKKILLVDLDPQGNATMGSGINKNNLSSTIADLLLSEVESFRDILLHSDEGYDLLPANQTLTYAELKLLEEKEREKEEKEGKERKKKIFFLELHGPEYMQARGARRAEGAARSAIFM